MSRTNSILVVVCASLALGFSGCGWSDPFASDYSGVDMLASRGLGAADFVDTYVFDPLTPPVDDYINYDATVANGGTLTAADYGTTTGLPSGAEATIHRLELVNLMPDGDFEASVVTAVPNNWSTSGAPSAFEVTNGAGAITGQSVQFDISSGQYGNVDLNANLLDGMVYPGIYHIQLDVRRAAATTDLTFDYGDGATTSYLQLNGYDWVLGNWSASTPIESVPDNTVPQLDVLSTFVSSASANDYLYVGSPTSAAPQAGFVDNVRVGRLDLLPHVSLTVTDSGVAGELALIPGDYTFSVYVKSEIDAEVTPATPNRFRSGQIVLGVNGSFATISKTVADWTAAAWKKVSVQFNLSSTDLATAPPLVLQISVSQHSTPAVGSILIAAPTLELVTSK